MNDLDRKRLFVEELWSWFARHKRVLPWRDLSIEDDTDRAYRVLVSEVMLQQTQVERVKIVFKNFLEIFPHIDDLAGASNREIILAWRGMGYNSRALRLRDAAKIIVSDHDAVFPREYDRLMSIKGIGPYTASAVRNFAFNIPTPCIDTNIRRILHRTFVGPENLDGTWSTSDTELLKIAEEVLEVAINGKSEIRNPKSEQNSIVENIEGSNVDREYLSNFDIRASDLRRDAANWHAALMDFGSLVQTKSNPKWNICPLTEKGIMKTRPQDFTVRAPRRGASTAKKEPGRFEGARYVPNRIFRGRIVELLRDEERGLLLEDIGQRICNDWEDKHKEWLKNLITKLVQDRMIVTNGREYSLGK